MQLSPNHTLEDQDQLDELEEMLPDDSEAALLDTAILWRCSRETALKRMSTKKKK